MALVVIGGHSRSVGKTSVVAGLIAALPEFHWTAMKITQYGHGICSANGEPCDCVTDDHTRAITEEHDRSGETDTSRFLVAGAQRSLWVRTRQGMLAEAMPDIRRRIAGAENVIMESNSVVRFLRPDLYLTVLDAGTADFKDSAAYRWLSKPVQDSRPLDDMEDLQHWRSFTTSGVAVVTSSPSFTNISCTIPSLGEVMGVFLVASFSS